MNRLAHIPYLIVYVFCNIFLFPPLSSAQDNSLLDIYRDADLLLYSGEVVWDVTYEAFLPAPPITLEQKPIGLSEEEFPTWVEKLGKYRKQAFQFRVFFQGDYVRFEGQSDPGDIYPVLFDQVLTFNGVSSTLMDNNLSTFHREACLTPYRDFHQSTFFILPRSCGYDAIHAIKTAYQVTDRHGNPAENLRQYDDVEAGNKTIVSGSFPETGTALLAELTPDTTYPQALKSIKFMKSNRHMETIECTGFKEFNDGIVFPVQSVVTHYMGGKLEDPGSAIMIDRLTLVTKEARFNQPLQDDLFNPSCPDGYDDLMNIRIRLKNNLHK